MTWKSNVDKAFEGVEECYICFSVIHGSNYQLPKQSCKTCHKKFHPLCLVGLIEAIFLSLIIFSVINLLILLRNFYSIDGSSLAINQRARFAETTSKIIHHFSHLPDDVHIIIRLVRGRQLFQRKKSWVNFFSVYFFLFPFRCLDSCMYCT